LLNEAALRQKNQTLSLLNVSVNKGGD